MNSTIAGPVCSLPEMFDAMDARDLDLWGMTPARTT
jgi:lipopolysaccharide biosynthesis protein